jgi:hypothetical protein
VPAENNKYFISIVGTVSALLSAERGIRSDGSEGLLYGYAEAQRQKWNIYKDTSDGEDRFVYVIIIIIRATSVSQMLTPFVVSQDLQCRFKHVAPYLWRSRKTGTDLVIALTHLLI